MKPRNELAEHQAILHLLPKTITFIEQHFNKLAVICNLNQIKHLLNKLDHIIQLPMFKVKAVFNNANNNYNFHVANKHLTYIQQLFENHVNNDKSVDLRLIKLINHQEQVIRSYYKWLKASIESLQDVNRRIIKNITKPLSNKIQTFLVRGASPTEGKLAAGQLLSNIITGSKLEPKVIVETFYKLFIENVFFITDDSQNNEQQIKELQDSIISKIINVNGMSLHQYFGGLMQHATSRPYSTSLLLQYFCDNDLVIDDVRSMSEQYKRPIIKFLKSIAQNQTTDVITKEYNEEYTKILAKLIFLFPNSMFVETVKACLNEVQLFFQPMYATWAEIFLETSKSENIDPNKLQLMVSNLRELFVFFHQLTPNMLYEQMKNIINQEQASATNLILRYIFPHISIIKVLDALSSPTDIKYCFDQTFFGLLLRELPTNCGLPINFKNNTELELFLNLGLYIGDFDRSNSVSVENVKKQLQKLKACIHVAKDVNQRLKQQQQQTIVLDLLKITAGYGSWQLRANSATVILTNIKDSQYANSTLDHIKADMLNIFIDNEDHSVKPTFYQHLAKTGYIHLLKSITASERRALVVEQLKKCNKAFRGYCAYLQKSGASFDLSHLTPGFNVPFYLSCTEKLNLPAADYNLVVSVAFKIFSHATDDYHDRAIDDYQLEFNEIINSVQRLLNFYEEQQQEFKTSDHCYKEIYKGYEQLKQDAIRFIIEGFNEDSTDSLMERKRNARLIIDNAINYKASQQQACSVNAVLRLELNEPTEETPTIIQQFFTEISSILKNTLARNGKTLTQWVDSTSSIGEKISFLCARRKYVESDFKTWFFKKNLHKINAQQLEPQLQLVRQDLNEPDHQAALSQVGINYLQYNQEYALALIYRYLTEHRPAATQEYNNLFMQLGTGQGKSLVIAETARKFLNSNTNLNQVFIITCYAHLAIRDHKRFAPYFNSLGIKAICCANLTEQQKIDPNLLLDHNIIYTDLKSYFDLIRSERKKLLEDQSSLLFPDPSKAILIMDEFDSLILDADEIYQYLTNYSGVGALLGDQKQKIKSFFGLNDSYTETALQHKLFNQWYDNMLKEQKRNPNGYRRENALGVVSNFAKAFLQHLEETGTAQFIHSFLSPLLFYMQFKQIIGFSGSITEQAMLDLEKVFCSPTGQPKRADYYCIPPFFGEENGKNRVFVNGPNGKLCSSETEFLDEIIKDVKEKRLNGQPILIFADISSKKGINQKTDFDLIKDRLQTFVAAEQLHIVKTEEDVVEKLHYIGKKDNVTLASRILARGADIKVDGYLSQGLHLLVTYYPPRGSVYTQMLGRTARQDEHGSYSVITMKPAHYEEGEPKILPTERKSHELCTYFFDKSRQGKKKWPLVFDILRETSMHENIEQLKNTIDRNFPIMKGA